MALTPTQQPVEIPFTIEEAVQGTLVSDTIRLLNSNLGENVVFDLDRIEQTMSIPQDRVITAGINISSHFVQFTFDSSTSILLNSNRQVIATKAIDLFILSDGTNVESTNVVSDEFPKDLKSEGRANYIAKEEISVQALSTSGVNNKASMSGKIIGSYVKVSDKIFKTLLENQLRAQN